MKFYVIKNNQKQYLGHDWKSHNNITDAILDTNRNYVNLLLVYAEECENVKNCKIFKKRLRKKTIKEFGYEYNRMMGKLTKIKE